MTQKLSTSAPQQTPESTRRDEAWKSWEACLTWAANYSDPSSGWEEARAAFSHYWETRHSAQILQQILREALT
jgi:hypothetical protein